MSIKYKLERAVRLAINEVVKEHNCIVDGALAKYIMAQFPQLNDATTLTRWSKSAPPRAYSGGFEQHDAFLGWQRAMRDGVRLSLVRFVATVTLGRVYLIATYYDPINDELYLTTPQCLGGEKYAD